MIDKKQLCIVDPLASSNAKDWQNGRVIWRVCVNVLLMMLIILFGLLHIADGIVTYFGLRFFDLEEVNPILTFCAEFIGLGYSIALFKMAELGFIAFLFLDRHKMRSPWITATLASAVVFYSWVVTNNVSLVLEA